jgi:hypothetical protein
MVKNSVLNAIAGMQNGRDFKLADGVYNAYRIGIDR